MINDHISEDPKEDLFYPPTQEYLVMDSNGFLLNGVLEIAQGKGPHPTILLLHGFPGVEKNGDLAQIFRRAGFNVVVFSYRGSWGSQGTFSFKNCYEDTINVINFLQSHNEEYRIKSDEIILIGTAFGGFIALYTAFQLESIDRVACISGFHLDLLKNVFRTNPPEKEILLSDFDKSMNPLVGTSSSVLYDEIMNIESWDFTDYYSVLAKKDLCLISSLKDEIVPPEIYHFPIVKNLEIYKPQRLFQEIFYDAYHTYSGHRIQLTKVLLKWLLKQH